VCWVVVMVKVENGLIWVTFAGKGIYGNGGWKTGKQKRITCWLTMGIVQKTTE
jgi:hypothetical protein